MKIITYFFSLMLIFTSCQSEQEKVLSLRPVKTREVAPFGSSIKLFPAVVEAENASNLTFSVSGTLTQFKIDEGQRVSKGQVLATINDRDFQLKLDARKADFEKAKSQLTRYKNLLEQQAVSVQEYEMAKAQYENAFSAYESAKKDLADTRLLAPFAGFIEKKFVDNYQEIKSGQNIVRLIDPNVMRIKFTLPEVNSEYILSGKPDFFVSFENLKGLKFKARFREIVESSVDGAGLPVYLTIDDPSFDSRKMRINSGFTCSVEMKLKVSNDLGVLRIPISAVFANEKNNATSVWVLDPKTQEVHSRIVKINRPIDTHEYIVLEGLKAGEIIVIAGIQRLMEGQTVKVITQ